MESPVALPDPACPPAASGWWVVCLCADWCGTCRDYRALFDALAPAYAAWEAVFVAEGFAPLRQEWLAHAARLGETIRARTGTQTREGVFETIDPAGNLILRMSSGPVAIPAAEVFF